MRKFVIKEEAEDYLNVIRGLIVDESTYCPLVRGACRRDCVCFSPPYIAKYVGSLATEYTVHEGSCINEMFSGR